MEKKLREKWKGTASREEIRGNKESSEEKKIKMRLILALVRRFTHRYSHWWHYKEVSTMKIYARLAISRESVWYEQYVSN